MNFLITVVLVILALAILVPLFIDFSGFGSRITCKTVCTMRPNGGSWFWPPDWSKKGVQSVLDYFRKNLKCPSCDSLKDLGDLPKGDTVVIKGNLEGGDSEGVWLEKFKLEDKGKSCNFKMKDMDEDKSGWLGTLGEVALGAGIVAGSILLAIATGGLSAVAEFGLFAAGGTLTSVAVLGGLTGGAAIAVHFAEEGIHGVVRAAGAASVSKELVKEYAGKLKEAKNLKDEKFKETVVFLSNHFTASFAKLKEKYGGCEEWESEENCTKGDRSCYWRGGSCKDTPAGGYDKYADVSDLSNGRLATCINTVIQDVSCSDLTDCSDKINIVKFRGVDNPESEEEIQTNKEAIKNLAGLVSCLSAKNMDKITYQELKETAEEYMKISKAKEVKDQVILNHEPGHCPGEMIPGVEGCGRRNAPEGFLKDSGELNGRGLLWMTPWDYDIQFRGQCSDCSLAMPTYSSEELKEKSAEEFAEGREGVYYWMPKGDLLCDANTGQWVMCNKKMGSVNYTIDVQGTGIDFTCSNYNWTLSEETVAGSRGLGKPEEATSPTFSSHSENSTKAGKPVEHSLKWEDNEGLSGYIFSFDNCTGNFVNDTWTAWSDGPTAAWSNVTKTVNSTVGCEAGWKAYANDTDGNWTVSNTFSYETT